MAASPSHTNAVAGPSQPPPPPAPPPALFLPPPGPAPPPTHLASTQDLLARFHLLPAYDRHVRPFATPVGAPGATPTLGPGPPASASALDKGKGREREPLAASTPAAAATPDGDDADARGDRKMKNNYKHLIRGIPGKHSAKKDDYLVTTMQAPPKQHARIVPFDARTQREAFAVSLEGLKTWNVNTLIAESAQAKEDRKKRKELKKLAKAQTLTGVGGPGPGIGVGTGNGPGPASISAAPTPTASAPTPGAYASAPTPGAGAGAAPPRAAVPRPGTGANASMNGSANGVNGMANGNGNGAPYAELPRGKKRELEADGAGAPGVQNGAGAGGAVPRTGPPKPRPLKKQRMDGHGLTPLQQQPTPQGV